MLTLFAVPKAFVGESDAIQRRAIETWRALGDVEILLIGDDPGVAEAAAGLGIRHVSGVRVNEYGTPLVSSAFALAERHARRPILAYANADLIFPASLNAAVRAASDRSKRFMLVGQCQEDGVLRGAEWIDYFVFPRGELGSLPPFAVGRPGWDNWMIWRARKLGLHLVDLTPSVRVVHQPHGYGHVQAPAGYRWNGPEGDANRTHIRLGRSLTIEEATHVFVDGEIRPLRHSLRRRVRVRLSMYDWSIPIYRAARWLYHAPGRAAARLPRAGRGAASRTRAARGSAARGSRP